MCCSLRLILKGREGVWWPCDMWVSLRRRNKSWIHLRSPSVDSSRHILLQPGPWNPSRLTPVLPRALVGVQGVRKTDFVWLTSSEEGDRCGQAEVFVGGLLRYEEEKRAGNPGQTWEALRNNLSVFKVGGGVICCCWGWQNKTESSWSEGWHLWCWVDELTRDPRGITTHSWFTYPNHNLSSYLNVQNLWRIFPTMLRNQQWLHVFGAFRCKTCSVSAALSLHPCQNVFILLVPLTGCSSFAAQTDVRAELGTQKHFSDSFAARSSFTTC